MKKNIALYLIGFICFSGLNVLAQDAPPSRVDKIFDEPALFDETGKITESIGVETLAGIVTTLIPAGAAAPFSAHLKIGVNSDCDCARFRIFRVPADSQKKPQELSYDAVIGFSADNKTVDLKFELMPERKLKVSIPVPSDLAPGHEIEWLPAREVKRKPKPKKAPEPVKEKVKEKAPVSTAVTEVPAKSSEAEKTTTAVDAEILAPLKKDEPVVMTWEVAPLLADCQGVAAMKCIQIKRTEDGDWELFYDSIKGFHFSEGFNYVVKVRESKVENPPADGSSFAYELIELVKKSPVPTPAEADLNHVWLLKSAADPELSFLAQGKKAVLELRVKQGFFSGGVFCNRYSGRFKAEEGKIKFLSLRSTNKPCKDQTAERTYFKTLLIMDHYVREGDELILKSGADEMMRLIESGR